MPADLHAWIQLMDAQWMAAISVPVPSGGGHCTITLELVVTADSIVGR